MFIFWQKVAQLEAVQQGQKEASPVRRVRNHSRGDGY
jgi:hypothetical protein